jgi:hypothetical protein
VSFLRQEYREDEEYDERPAAVIIYLVLVLALLVLWLLSLTRRGEDVVVAEPEAEPTVSSVTTTTPAPAVVVPRETGRLTVDGEPVFPLSEYAGPNQDLSPFAGGEAIADRVPVESVPADEGFWLGENTTDRVWVQLVNVASESPYKVEPGDIVTFVGRVVPTSSDFPQDVGVTAAEGAEQMRDQRQHIQVEGIALELYD